MKTLVLGASGATGKKLVEQLLNRQQEVKAIVRSVENLPSHWKSNDLLTLIKAEISKMGVEELKILLEDCDAVVSCLGHNLSWRGVYGKPRKLVTDAVQLICTSQKARGAKPSLKLVLMSSVAVSYPEVDKTMPLAHRIITGLLYILLPPQTDNEKAAKYLRSVIRPDHPAIEWVAVRPDSLTDEEAVSPYTVYPSPVRSGILDPGKTSRINVGDFMARLITEEQLWKEWKGKMPVIYNTGSDTNQQ